MPNDPRSAEIPPLTPCIGICRLDERGYCVGCQRTGDEIGRWRVMSDAERRYVMQVILPTRELP
ncbi:DUF1289 domain-containing protein [Rhodanobacter sp. C03]|uniref:DUF1289 domain-containing protein n=1 Tax=Rhodanobacter sp. C03 TaxID=1945858 RepID=UPI001115A317